MIPEHKRLIGFLPNIGVVFPGLQESSARRNGNRNKEKLLEAIGLLDVTRLEGFSSEDSTKESGVPLPVDYGRLKGLSREAKTFLGYGSGENGLAMELRRPQEGVAILRVSSADSVVFFTVNKAEREAGYKLVKMTDNGWECVERELPNKGLDDLLVFTRSVKVGIGT